MNNFSTLFNFRISKRYKPGITILTVLLFVIQPQLVLHAQQGVAPTTTPQGGFSIDGNLLSRTPVTANFSPDNGDFLPNINAPGNGGYVFTDDGYPVDTATSFHIFDGYGPGDAEIFTQGSKFNDDPNTWVWKEGKAPGKDDINHVLFHFSADSLGNIWFIGSGDRLKTKGNTYLDFELLQQPLYQNTDFTFTSLGMHGGRTIGDLAITVEYTNGGWSPQLIIYQWSEASPGNYGYEEVSPAAGTYYLSTNSDSAVVVPYGAFGKDTYEEFSFSEVAVNINEVVAGNYTCLDIKTVLAKTKASQSYNAALKDLASPVQVDILSKPEVSVNDTAICDGDTATLTPNVMSGTGPFTYNWSTGDTTATISVAPDTTTTYWVVVTGVNGCPSDTAYATVTVYPLPVVSVNDASVCYGDTAMLTATVISGNGPFTYLWTTGDTSQTIYVAPDTTTTYGVVVTGSNGCPSDTAYGTVTVFPLPDCFITGADTICPLGMEQFSGPDTMSLYAWTVYGPAMIIGDTAGQMVEVQGTGYCDTTFILELYVIDTNGCASTCSINVVMSDTLSPVISNVPDSLFVDCFSDVPVASIDSVTVTDNCTGDLYVTVSDSIYNDTLCPNKLNMLRTWTAMDTCGNYSMATQFISVFDSIAPVLYDVPADTGYCCPDSIPPPADVTAIDNCDGQVPVDFTEVVSDSTGPNMFILTRTWTAEDTCQNMATASQVIEINDSLYPGGGNVGIGSYNDIVLYFKALPNPFKTNMTIEFSLSQNTSVTLDLYNFTGVKLRTIFTGDVMARTPITTRLSPDAGMKPGMYMLVLRTQYGIVSKKVMLMR